MNAHQQEVKRLGRLLDQYRPALTDPYAARWSPEQEVEFILSHYRPRIEWTDETPERDPYSDDFRLRVGGFRSITASIRIGDKLIKYEGTVNARTAARAPEMIDRFKHHVRARLGEAFARWADGEEVGE